ncbi:AsnC family transcriptional regulator [Pseudomonas putida S16]|nr:AsnC family transcriptional regulator [Pseudomonas putida S16]
MVAVFFRYDLIISLYWRIDLFIKLFDGEFSMHSELDAYDRRILELLQEDASLSSAQIAERVGLSQSPCWRRIQRLKEEGVIRGQVTLLDRKKVGLNTQIFAEVKLNAHGRSNFTEFTDAIRGFPEVLECYVLMGSVDFLLRIVTPDIEAYERFFFEKLSNVPGIQEVNSIVALSEIKSTTSLPLSR